MTITAEEKMRNRPMEAMVDHCAAPSETAWLSDSAIGTPRTTAKAAHPYVAPNTLKAIAPVRSVTSALYIQTSARKH